jgi:hypothetical protein
VIVKSVVKSFGLFVKVLDEGVDVIFAIRAVQTAAIERRVQAVAKFVRLIFHSMKNPLYLFIVQSIRLPDHLCVCTCRNS